MSQAQIRIDIDPNTTVAHVSRTMTGACIEDVNHELYGGIYSQMIFGEHFVEPAANRRLVGFTAFGGAWTAADGVLTAKAGDGPKLVAEGRDFDAGVVEVEMLLPAGGQGYGGLLVNVSKPGVGTDAFDGYEVSLDGAGHKLVLGRHRQNWEPLGEYPCDAVEGKWMHLSVGTRAGRLEVSLDGKRVAVFEDGDRPLGGGAVALRPWKRDVLYRNLSIKVDGKTTALPFEHLPPQPEDGVSGMWSPVFKGDATGRFSLEAKDVLDSPQAQRIVFESGNGSVGIGNKGLNRWGMGYRKGKPYEGVLWAKTDRKAKVWVSLESGDGKRCYGEKALSLPAGKWTRLPYKVTSTAEDGDGRFVVSLREPGDVLLGYASLEPGAWGRFKGLPVRKDVGDALVAQGLTVLRMGGCMVNTDTYRWKDQIGPRDRRKPNRGFWHPNSSNGWGSIEFIEFCRAAGFLCVPDFNMGEKPEDMADLIEYVNGPKTSKWGKLRAEHGHPEPYNLRYIQLGNEEQLNEAYWSKFEPMAKAIWAKDPKIVVVVGDFAYHGDFVDPWNFAGAAGCSSLAIQKKILDLAKAQKRPVWFDVHVGNDEPRQVMAPGGSYVGLRSYIRAMKKIADGADFKVVVFEENAGNHTLRRGLGHARMIGRLEPVGDDVPIVCAANCLQPDGQNDNGWDQGLLFLSPTGVWGQSSYYVTQMISRNFLPLVVAAKLSDDKDLDVTAKRSEDGRLLQIQVVNMAEEDIVCEVGFGGWVSTKGTCQATCISGAWDDANTEPNPKHIAPKSSRKKVSGGGMRHKFPARSFTILRFE